MFDEATILSFRKNLTKTLNIPTYNFRDWNFRVVKHTSNVGDGYNIIYGQEYESPKLNFSTLKELSEIFGTDDIDVDHYSRYGCETCDWGSDYGHEIQIYNLTKNEDLMEELINHPIKR